MYMYGTNLGLWFENDPLVYIVLLSDMYQWLGRNTQARLLSVLILLAILYVSYITYKHTFKREGFTGIEDKYIIKRNESIYDDYYANIYDKIYEPKRIAKEVSDFVINFTQASKEQSLMLDCGSGTGELAAQIADRGFKVVGVEKSDAMIDTALEKYPTLKIKLGDVNSPMLFDKATFSHILCIGLQNPLYLTREKETLFHNFYHWLIPHGYLLIQLVERNKFSTIPPSGRSNVVDNPHEIAEGRLTDTEITFVDFQYKSSYDFSNENEVVVKETFTDFQTRNVRQNEQRLYIEDIDVIIEKARKCGFLVHGQVNLMTSIGDENQYIFLLEKS